MQKQIGCEKKSVFPNGMVQTKHDFNMAPQAGLLTAFIKLKSLFAAVIESSKLPVEQ